MNQNQTGNSQDKGMISKAEKKMESKPHSQRILKTLEIGLLEQLKLLPEEQHGLKDRKETK